MNFLAHLYLSGNNEEWKLGGFIADAVKGNRILKYPVGIRQGIVLHRRIDVYTDNHPIFKQSAERLKPRYKRYSGVITDVFYDHFLNVYWNKYSEENISDFVKDFYVKLLKNYFILPPKFRMMIPFLVYNNWLISYGTFDGLNKRLEGMSKRTTFYSGMGTAIDELQEHYKQFQSEFFVFFDDLLAFVEIEKNKIV